MTPINTSTEAIEALLKDVLPGPWAYRPQKFDDWGYVRAPDVGDGWMPFICQAKSPSTEGEEDEARRNGTDPWGANARFIAASRELVPALRAERDALRAEVDRLRADTDLLVDAYLATLVLQRILDRVGLTIGASTASEIVDKIVAAHPDFPARSSLRTGEPK